MKNSFRIEGVRASDTIKMLMRMREVTTFDIADALDCSQGTAWSVINGRSRTVTDSDIRAIAKLLDVPAPFLTNDIDITLSKQKEN